MNFISGADRSQIILLPDSVDGYIDDNNAVRVIEAYINSLDLNALGFAKSAPNDMGRPMYAPQDLLKLYLYGYMNRVRSSRRLEIETKRNLEVIWLMRKLSPDHKTIARFRHDNPVALKNVFKDFVKLCIRLGLYGKELVAVDGSKFKAVNAKDCNFNVKKLNERIARLDAKIEKYLQQMEEVDKQDDADKSIKSAEEVQRIISELAQRKAGYQSFAEELKESGESQKSLTDPDSRLMMANGKMDICYNVQTVTDSKNKLLVGFEVTNEAVDKNQLERMSDLAINILEQKELNVTADVGYDSATEVARCLMKGIVPHVAGSDYDVCLPTDDFSVNEITSHTNGRSVYLADRNVAVCPMGKVLYPGGYKKRGGKALFYNFRACAACPCKCTVERYKKFEITMDKAVFKKTYDDKNLLVKQIRVAADKEIVRQRKSIAEHPFGTVKRTMDAGYLLTRGFQNVSGEFSLTFLAYNLKRALNILGTSRMLKAIKA